MIKEASDEYNNLRSFASRFSYPYGDCKNILDLLQKSRWLTEQLVDFNDNKITAEELSQKMVESFSGDIEAYYKERKAILEPIIERGCSVTRIARKPSKLEGEGSNPSISVPLNKPITTGSKSQ